MICGLQWHTSASDGHTLALCNPLNIFDCEFCCTVQCQVCSFHHCNILTVLMTRVLYTHGQILGTLENKDIHYRRQLRSFSHAYNFYNRKERLVLLNDAWGIWNLFSRFSDTPMSSSLWSNHTSLLFGNIN